MSFVIQNFSKNNYRLTVTPRFKIFLILKWINFFFFFFKFNNLFRTNFEYNFFSPFFFKKGLFKIFYKSLLNLSANYTNRITLTATYWSFKTIDESWNTNFLTKNVPFVENYYLFNLYFLSLKTINIKLTKSFHKFFFFFILFYFSETWTQFGFNFKFYLNFFFIKSNFKFYKFYNGYFLRVNSF